MDAILEILKYLLPSLVVFGTTVYLVNRYFNNEEKVRRQQAVMASRQIITPLRLQAYERAILFLERITPDNLIMRVSKGGQNVQQLHSEMIQAIRSEYEHNLAQQIYLSHGSWEMLKIARGRTIQIINSKAEKLHKTAPALELSKAILESMVDEEKAPTTDAIVYIKKEIAQLF